MPRFTPTGAGVVPFEERHPLVPATGRNTLDTLLESPDAPLWNHQCGDRLDRDGLGRVNAYAASLLVEPPRWDPDRRPPWLPAYLDHVRRVVPRYRDADAASAAFATGRADLANGWWKLVPDDADLNDLIWFPTSGSGGAPVVVPTHPVSVSCYYPLLLHAARWQHVTVNFRADRADWMTVVSQQQGGFTVPSWSSFLGCATAKVNLDDSDWRESGCCRRFLAQHDPQVITGDPVSLSHLAELDVDLHPKLLFSTALHLSAATRQRLTERFGCPVIDVYSTTESGPIAASRPAGGLGLLQPRLFIEVLDDDGNPCAPGSFGSVTLTGGMNPFLPLLRYRTADSARLVWSGDEPVLEDLIGRAVVMLRGSDGSQANSFDVVTLFAELPLRRWTVHQRADASIIVRRELEAAAATDIDERIDAAIRRVLGAVVVTVEPLQALDKVTPFTVESPP
jgi:phenylacetate-CoA ligase